MAGIKEQQMIYFEREENMFIEEFILYQINTSVIYSLEKSVNP